MRVEEMGSLSRPSLNSRSPVTSNPASAPMSCSMATLPRRPWPKWKSWPTTTALVSRQPMSTSLTKSSAGSTARCSSKWTSST